MAGNWQRLESVRWLKHLRSGKLVPVVGSLKHKLCTLASLDMPCSFNRRSLKKLLNGNILTLQGWHQCVDAPALLGSCLTAQASSTLPSLRERPLRTQRRLRLRSFPLRPLAAAEHQHAPSFSILDAFVAV